MIRVRVDGTEIAVERRGTGPPLVLVHGLGGPAMWVLAAPILAERFDVVLPHLPGFGDSEPPGRALKTGDHARLLSRLLDSLSLARVTLAGISYGGEIAAAIAADRPDRVSGLVLICPTGTRRYPAPFRSGRVRSALRPLLRRALANPRIAETLSRRSFHDPGARPAGLVAGHLERLRLPGRLDALIDAVDEVWSGDGNLAVRVEKLDVPMTLVWGEDERTVPPGYAAPLRASRPDAELVVIPGAGHSIPLERPAELAAAMTAAAGRHRS